uniref:Uncharacterized protein n=2 Tax=Clytia hemisphaerica TaxID=252671 RepID=A0A7M5VBV5_9CNID
ILTVTRSYHTLILHKNMKIFVVLLLFVGSAFAENDQSKCDNVYKDCVYHNGPHVFVKLDCKLKELKCRRDQLNPFSRDEEEVQDQYLNCDGLFKCLWRERKGGKKAWLQCLEDKANCGALASVKLIGCFGMCSDKHATCQKGTISCSYDILKCVRHCVKTQEL